MKQIIFFKEFLFIFFIFLLFLSGCTVQQKGSSLSFSYFSNPAAKKCFDNGGNYTSFIISKSGIIDTCVFPNHATCEGWAYLQGECSPIKPTFCLKDSDCACGTNTITKECFAGQKEFVNTSVQCPDFCT
ncbi:MAG: DUF333 domain-containing protein, partial [Candidatus Anstonellaceae archaeon]